MTVLDGETPVLGQLGVPGGTLDGDGDGIVLLGCGGQLQTSLG